MEEEPNLNPHKKIVRINSSFRIWWDVAMISIALFEMFAVPFYIAFYESQFDTFFYWNFPVNMIFCLDVLLNFVTTFIDESGEEIYDYKKIARNYMRFNFWIDIVGSLPLGDIIAAALESNQESYWALDNLLQMNRILRAGRIIRYIRTVKTKVIYKLVRIIVYLIIWFHFSTCFWWLTVSVHGDWIPFPDFLPRKTDVWHSNIWYQFWAAWYHGSFLVRGGEVAPIHFNETMFASVFIMLGGLVTAFLFREMMFLLTILRQKKTNFYGKLDRSIEAMGNMQLSENLKRKILDYIISTEVSLSAQEEYETFQNFISPSLLKEVSACIYYPIISLNPIMSNEEGTVEMIVKHLSNIFTRPEEEIIRVGDPADAMYFLVYGECSVSMHDRYGAFKTLSILTPGSHFGEIGIAFNSLRTANVISLGYCTIAKLTKTDYNNWIKMFSHLEQKVKSYAFGYKDPWKEFIISCLKQANFLEFLHPDALSEIVYRAEVTKLEKDTYLFKPGDPVSAMYIIADGAVDLSITINEKHIHTLKKSENILGIETSPRKKTKRPVKNTDYGKYYVDIGFMKNLKHRAEVIPIMNDKATVGSICPGEAIPDKTKAIGNYPQEIIIDTLTQGTLINPYLMLYNETNELQCKTIQPCTVYTIKASLFEKLTGNNNTDCKREFKKLTQSRPRTVDWLDYYKLDIKNEEGKVNWKSAIVRVILEARKERKRFLSRFGVLLSKLHAVRACENAGNFDLADKVISGQIDPESILDDGTLDVTDSKQMITSYLPRSHPIMKAFNSAISSITTTEGHILKEYNTLEAHIDRQYKTLNSIGNQIDDLQFKMSKINDMLHRGGLHKPRNIKSPDMRKSLDGRKSPDLRPVRKSAPTNEDLLGSDEHVPFFDYGENNY